jgi:hypothetical protein
MILKSSNWKPSFIRSIKGRSDYNFLNQIFEFDVDKLKIEVSIINGFSQTQILPATLTVIYEENIEDEVFAIPVGDKKPLTTLIDNLKPYPFKLSLNNPNKSPILVLLQKPKVTRAITYQNMNYIGTGNSTADPALLAATLANAAAIGTLATAMGNAPGQIADAIANNQMIDENFPNTLVGTTIQQLLPVDQTRQSAIITNWSLFKVKLWKSTAPIASLSYGSDGAFITLDAAKQVGSETIQGGVASLDADEAKGNIYAVGQQIAGVRGVAITTTKTAP